MYRKLKKNNLDLLDINEIKEEDTTPNIKYYFKSLWRKFPKLMSINLIMLFQIIPFIIAFFAYTVLMPRIYVFTDPLYPVLSGISTISNSPIINSFLGFYGISIELPTIAFGSAAIIIAICALFLFITFGWQNVGAAYLTRELVRGRAVFVLSDYFYAIKRNFKQGFLLGAIDFIASAVLIFDFIYFYSTPGDFVVDLMFWGICGVGILYIFMRYYIYLMLINFDLPIRKILKNALIFTALGFKRNILSGLWIIIVAVINVILAFALLPSNIIIPMILPLFYFAAFALFTSTYAAYPIIKKYMIDPYYDEDGNPRAAAQESE
jgi:uncharacterized membrane protein YesL